MFKAGVLLITTATIAFMYWSGLSINHLVILAMFAISIFFGTLVIMDNDEKKDDMYEDFGKPAKMGKGKKP